MEKGNKIIGLLTHGAVFLIFVAALLFSRNVKILEENRALTDTLQIVTAGWEGDPTPAWLKAVTPADHDAESPLVTMLYVNTTYEKRFGVTLEQYAGKTDFEVWPSTVATVFYENDKRVLKTGGSTCGEEKVSEDETVVVCKWLVKLRKDFWLIGGRVIPTRKRLLVL